MQLLRDKYLQNLQNPQDSEDFGRGEANNKYSVHHVLFSLYVFSEEEGRTCDTLCDGGCWGPGPSQCASCKKFQRGTECVEQCNIYQG